MSERHPRRVVAGHEATLHPNGVGGQGQSGRGNTGGPVISRLVGNQPVGRVDLLQKVFERLPLKPVQQAVIILRRPGHGYGPARSGAGPRGAGNSSE